MLRRVELPPWLAGTLLAGLVALALLVPFARDVESRVLDLLFRYGRVDPPRMSDAIVHADIDDGALETVGRWPWPRSRLADAVRALDGCGARVIVLDILLEDEQEADYDARGEVVDHDAALAEALAGARATTLLAVRTEGGSAGPGPLWRGEEGAAAWRRVLDALRDDITMSADEAARRARLDAVRTDRLRGRLLEFKKHAVRAELAARRDASLETLREALLPPDKRHYASFPELRLLEGALRRARALETLHGRFPRAAAGIAAERVEVAPPLPALVAAADGAGLVDAHPDGDGKLRRVRLRAEAGGRLYVQLGVAAAAAYLGLPLSALAHEEKAVRVGENELPLEDGMHILSWPRFSLEEGAASLGARISLGRAVDLVRAERALAEQEARLAERAGYLAARWFPDGEPSPDELRDEVDFHLSQYPDDVLQRLDELEEEERAIVANALEWRLLRDETARAGAALDAARLELRAAVAGRIVFVGANASGNFGDFFPTAVEERTPGVSGHATIANSCLTGYAVRSAGVWAGIAATLLLGAAAAAVAGLAWPRLALLVTLLLAVVFLAFDILPMFNERRIHLAAVTPLSGLLVGWASVTVLRVVREKRERTRLQRQFGSRISGQLFRYLLAHPDQVDLGGREREVTTFFSDLAGFTAISEKLDSRATVALLNRYMSGMNAVLTEHDAYVNKFLGDGIMAVWGAFSSEKDQAEKACRAALACLRRMDDLAREPGFPPLSMRVGIATGVATVGDCGAPPDLRDYTAIGDSVNLAARLESAGKQFGASVLIDARTKDLLPDTILTRPLGAIAVVGQETPTEVHELIAERGEESAEQRDLAEVTTRAVQAFRAGDLEASLAAWEEMEARHGPSKLVALYRDAIGRARDDASFDGVVRLESK